MRYSRRRQRPPDRNTPARVRADSGPAAYASTLRFRVRGLPVLAWRQFKGSLKTARYRPGTGDPAMSGPQVVERRAVIEVGRKSIGSAPRRLRRGNYDAKTWLLYGWIEVSPP